MIVGMTENDIRKLDSYPIHDEKLAELLNKIKAQKPAAIGLDLIRDKPQPPGYDKLVKVFTTTPNLIGAGSILKDSSNQLIGFPPKLEKLGQIADISTPIDRDSQVRRGFLYTSSSSGQVLRSLSYQLALIYLEKLGIEEKTSQINTNWLKLKETSFPWFKGNDGGYVFEANGDYNIIINWRKNPQPFEQISFFEVLDKTIDKNFFTDKIVLIGSTAPSVGDTFITPLSLANKDYLDKNYGVVNLAHLTSQILNAVLEKRPLIKTIPNYLEFLELFFVVLIISWLFLKVEANPVLFLSKIVLTIMGVSGLLFGIHYWAFLNGYWIPLAPLLWGVVVSGIIDLRWGLNHYRQKKEVINKLNAIVVERWRNPSFIIKSAVSTFLPHLEQIATTRQEKENLVLLKENLDKLSKIPDLIFPCLNHVIFIKISDLVEWIDEIIEQEVNQKGFDKEVRVEIIRETKPNDSLRIPKQIEFVIVSLLKNSLDSVLEKREKAPTSALKIIIEVVEYEKTIRLIIRDNGIGIKSNEKNLIFEPFYTTKKENLGVGLYFSKEIIKKIKGSIKLSVSNKNKTEFMVEFPYEH